MRYEIVLLVSAIIGGCLAADGSLVHPVWLSPTNTSKANYNQVWTEIGIWTDLDVGAGGRAGHCMVLDSNRILWIFGGLQDVNLYDVWSFNMTSGQYRLVYKAPNSEKKYGTQGVASADVHPGALEWPSCTIDSKDKIFIYHTFNFWSFDTTSWHFTWIYGNESTTEPENEVFPGSTYGACLEADSEDNLWLVGTTGGSDVPSVWKRDASDGWWYRYWSTNTATIANHVLPEYGSRRLHSCTIDTNDKIWIFGGSGPSDPDKPQDFSSLWSDLWTFDTKALTAPWEVVFGSAASYDDNGNLVEPFKFNALNAPATRNYASNLVDRMDGTLLLYGGYGNYEGTVSAKQDMWLFNKTSREWALASGGIELDDLAITETILQAEGNYAGARYYHAIAGGSRNLRGDMIFYAGQTGGFSYYKDVWIVPQDQCALGLDNCDLNADCVDTVTGFGCVCKEGYEGDGVTCSEISAPGQSPSSGPSASAPQTGAPSSTNQPVGKTSTGTVLNVGLFAVIAFLVEVL